MATNQRPTETELDRALWGALDNELGDGLDSETARANVIKRAAAYADTYGLDAIMFRAYVVTQIGQR